MKKLAIVLGLALVSSTAVMAQTKAASGKVSFTEKVSNLSVQDLGSLRFKVAFENPARQKAQIYLLDKENNVYFNDYATGDAQYVKAFDLSNLADGKYTFVVASGSDKFTKEFAIKTETFRGIALASDRK